MHWICCDVAAFSEEDLHRTYAGLSPSRKEHIDRIQPTEDKKRSLAGECLVQKLLQTHYGITNATLHRSENGQPYLSGCELYVSISHSHKIVACAISEEPVGIDVERIRPVKPELHQRVCVPEELKYIRNGDNAAERFFEIWTAKEAWFKKQGTGITNLHSVNVLEIPREMHRIEDYILHIV